MDLVMCPVYFNHFTHSEPASKQSWIYLSFTLHFAFSLSSIKVKLPKDNNKLR